MLLDLKVDGPDKPARKVLVHPGRTGYMYILDRATGQVLSAEPFGRITAAKGVDLKTGRLIINEEKKPQIGKVIRDVQPASPGMKDWQPSAYSPRTGWLYVPHQNLTCDYEAVEANYIAGTPYLGVNERMYAGPGRIPRQVHGVGPGREKGNLEHQGKLPRLERHGRDRRRRRVLRNDGPPLQSRQREDRRGAVGLRNRLGNHRPAGHLQRPRRQAVRRDPRRRGRLGGRGRRRPARPARSVGGAGICQRDEGSARSHQTGRQALCLCTPLNHRVMCRGARALRWAAAALAALRRLLRAARIVPARRRSAGRSRHRCARPGPPTQPVTVLRVCADPNNLPFSNRNHEGFEDKIAALIAARSGLAAGI